MKRNIIKVLLLIVLPTTMLFVSCTKDFESINTNPAGVTSDVFTADYNALIQPLISVQRSLIHYQNWEYQLQQNLNADHYSGFFTSATPFNGGSYNAQYFMMDGWNEWVLNIAYPNVLQPLTSDIPKAMAAYKGIDFSDVTAMMKVLSVIEMHKAADVFGPIIYTKYGKPNADLSVDFDSQQDAYNAFFANLDTAANNLQPYAAGTKTVGTTFKKADLIYGGDPQKWLQLVNTLRLRLALRIAYADPTTAKLQGEKALNPTNGGLILNNSSNAFVAYGSAHPIYDIINNWDDIRAGAPLICYLNGYKDPRLTKYAIPATDAIVSGQYIGIRSGILLDDKSRYVGYSKPAAKGAMGDYFDGKAGFAKIATASEAYFLMAEASLRGWANAGNIQFNYESGIAKSFEEWGAGSSSSYITDATSTEQPYIDPKAKTAGQNDLIAGSPYISTITIKWDAAATFEQQLEKIITQKWIALYPDGQEAWSEFRRSGYPKLMPVVVNNSGGTISTTAFIRRLPIPSKYQKSDQAGYNKAITTLVGPDNGGTKLWWDKK